MGSTTFLCWHNLLSYNLRNNAIDCWKALDHWRRRCWKLRALWILHYPTAVKVAQSDNLHHCIIQIPILDLWHEYLPRHPKLRCRNDNLIPTARLNDISMHRFMAGDLRTKHFAHDSLLTQTQFSQLYNIQYLHRYL